MLSWAGRGKVRKAVYLPLRSHSSFCQETVHAPTPRAGLTLGQGHSPSKCRGFDLSCRSHFLQTWVLMESSAQPRRAVKAQTLHHIIAKGRAKPQPSVRIKLRGSLPKRKRYFVVVRARIRITNIWSSTFKHAERGERLSPPQEPQGSFGTDQGGA